MRPGIADTGNAINLSTKSDIAYLTRQNISDIVYRIKREKS